MDWSYRKLGRRYFNIDDAGGGSGDEGDQGADDGSQDDAGDQGGDQDGGDADTQQGEAPLTRAEIAALVADGVRAALPQQQPQQTQVSTPDFDFADPAGSVTQIVTGILGQFQQGQSQRAAAEAEVMAELDGFHPQAQAYVRRAMAGVATEALSNPETIQNAKIMARGYEAEKNLAKVVSSPGTKPVQATSGNVTPPEVQKAIQQLEAANPRLKGRITPAMVAGAFDYAGN